MERTLVIIKPDSISRGLAGEILSRFEKKGLKIIAVKMVKLKRKQLEELYSHLLQRPFIEEYLKFMRKTPVILVILEGMGVVDIVRKMCGVTNGRDADPSTMRGMFSMSGRMNLVHASDSAATAEKEISLFFKPREIYDYKSLLTPMIYFVEEMQAMDIQKKGIEGRPRKMPDKED